MEETPLLYTATMARVLEDQGEHAEALSIYRHLLAVDPVRSDLIEAKNRIEIRMRRTSLKRTTRLLERWVDLLLIQNRMRGLKCLKQQLNH